MEQNLQRLRPMIHLAPESGEEIRVKIVSRFSIAGAMVVPLVFLWLTTSLTSVNPYILTVVAFFLGFLVLGVFVKQEFGGFPRPSGGFFYKNAYPILHRVEQRSFLASYVLYMAFLTLCLAAFFVLGGFI